MMTKLLIAYDRNRRDDYGPLIDALVKLGAEKVQYSLWTLETASTPFEIGRLLQPLLDAGDKLDVFALGFGHYSWPPHTLGSTLANALAARR
jgi:hypothetical protein